MTAVRAVDVADPIGRADRDKPLTVGDLDETYVELCLLDGGFPRAVIDRGCTFYVYPNRPAQ
jgi:hypothetical protein